MIEAIVERIAPMRSTVSLYCSALDRGDFHQAAALIDPEDRLAFWQSMSDIQEALQRLGEIGPGPGHLPFGVPGRRVADQDPLEFLESFFGQTLRDGTGVRYSVDTVDEVAPGRGLAVYSVEGLTNTLDLIRRQGQWFIKLHYGVGDLAAQIGRQVEDFLTRSSRDRPPVVEGELQKIELHGYADPSGQVVIEPRFSAAEPFSEGLAAVQGVTSWGYIDARGRMVIPAQFRYARPFSEGLAWVMGYDDDYTYSLIDREGRQVLPVRYSEVHDFSEGVAAVRETDLWGYIDRTGAYLIQPRFFSASSFHSGCAHVDDPDHGFIAVDRAGRPVTNPYDEDVC